MILQAADPVGDILCDGQKRTLRDRFSITSFNSSSSSDARSLIYAEAMDSIHSHRHRHSRSLGALVPTITERSHSDQALRNSGKTQTMNTLGQRPQNSRFASMPFDHYPVRPSEPIEEEGPSRQVSSQGLFQDPGLKSTRYARYRSEQELSGNRDLEARVRSREVSMTRENVPSLKRHDQTPRSDQSELELPRRTPEIGHAQTRNQTPGTVLPRPSQDHSRLESNGPESSRPILPRPTMPQKQHSFAHLLGGSPHEIMEEMRREGKNTLPNPRAYRKNPKGLPDPRTYSRNKLPPVPSSPTPSSERGVPGRYEHPDPVAKAIEEEYFRKKEIREWGAVMEHPIVAERSARSRARAREEQTGRLDVQSREPEEPVSTGRTVAEISTRSRSGSRARQEHTRRPDVQAYENEPLPARRVEAEVSIFARSRTHSRARQERICPPDLPDENE